MPIPKAHSQAETVLQAIYDRRSIRKFTKQEVSKETVLTLIDAAVQAPSAMNRQPWAFVVIQDRPLLTRISEAAKRRLLAESDSTNRLGETHFPFGDPAFDIFYGASTLIVICRSDEEGFSPEGDCYLAGENLMLAAHALGLGTCPIGFARDVLETQSFREQLAIPPGYRASLPILVGYPKGIAEPTPRATGKILAWR